MDTGFLVFNRRTYPNLCALFALLQVEAVETEMSFGVSLAEPELEWAGTDLGTVFAQRTNLVRPAFLGMLRDILRFNRETTRMAQEGTMPALSLGEYLAIEGYSRPSATGTCCPWRRRSGPARHARCWPTRSPPSCSSATTTACFRSSTGRPG